MANGIVLGGSGQIPLDNTGLRREVADVVKANIRQLLVDAISDKVGHAMAVAVGQVNWREMFVREMGPFFGNNRAKADDFGNSTYEFLRAKWYEHYGPMTPNYYLDKVHIESPKSEKQEEEEAEDAWEIEIASDEAAMQRHYYGSARKRKGKDAFSTFWNKNGQSVLADLKKTH